MKKWNKPQLFNLGLQNTKEDQDPNHSFGKHYCHREPGIHNGNCDEGEGHTAINTGACIDHTTGTPNHPEYSCCCRTLIS